MSTESQADRDKNLVRRAYTDSGETAQVLRRSVTFEMAEQRLAAENWFWSEAKQDLVHVTESQPSASGN